MFAGAKFTVILCLLTIRTEFFVCFNYPTFRICNQPCIAFIYLLFIFSFAVDGKRAPTVVSRGSSPRSRTGCDIFNFGNRMGYVMKFVRGVNICFNLIQLYGLRQGERSSSQHHAGPDGFNLMQSHGLRRTAKCLVPKMGLISILCSHTGCDSNNTTTTFCV